MNHLYPLFVYLLMALIVAYIPLVRHYFSCCNKLCHEVIRLLIEGKSAKKIKIGQKSVNLNEHSHSRMKHILITYGGHTCESLVAVGLFYLVSKQNYQLILFLFIGVLVVTSLFWIRNVIGIVWALSFVTFLALPIYFKINFVIVHIGIFLASFLLIQSIINVFKIWRKSFRKKNAEGGFFSRVKLLPIMLGCFILLGQSLYTGYFIAINFWGVNFGLG
ncbi:M50 family metallopeptidase [Metabacillus halosaccharovorans]|uniref:M50 family metallopeptidase n=1 Tax=Metabacillus halosaccharovorans TaxID=930124 RepID=UPI003734C463